MITNEFGDEYQGLAQLAQAIFGVLLDDDGELVTREDQDVLGEVRLVKEALLELPEREYRLMSMRFGFGGFIGRRHTLEEVAESEDITRERVRQIEQKTLARMRLLPGILEEIQELITDSSTRSSEEDN